jgi:hypothetical protein
MNEQEHLTTSDLAAIPPRQEGNDEGDSARAPQPATEASPASDSAGESGSSAALSDSSELLDRADRDSFQDRWQAIQTGFVDEPRRSVEQADALVAEAMKRLAEIFAQERQSLESQWGEGTSVSTEELRVALQRYRSFFQRLLTV